MDNQEPERLSRRVFLAGATAISAQRVSGANDRIRCGVIGTGGRGSFLIGLFKAQGTDVAAVCDVYEPKLRNGVEAASPGARSFYDYRRLLEDKSLDAVVIATPDHLHAQMLVDALQAGKDVYVEKPLAHTIEDGFRMVAATRRSKQVVQVGTQRRSYDLYREAKQIMDSGATGQVHLVNAWWLNYDRGRKAPPVQGRLEWDLFLGPLPKRPLDPDRFFNWQQYWDYARGYPLGQAAHIVDGVQWMMNSSYPTAVTCSAGKNNRGTGEIPDTGSISIEYPENYLLVFTTGYRAMYYRACNDQMQQFHGTKARFDLGRESYALYPQSSAVQLVPSKQKSMPDTFDSASGVHVANFLECMRTRKEPNAPIETGNATNIALCMGVEALRVGRRLRWDPESRRMLS